MEDKYIHNDHINFKFKELKKMQNAVKPFIKTSNVLSEHEYTKNECSICHTFFISKSFINDEDVQETINIAKCSCGECASMTVEEPIQEEYNQESFEDSVEEYTLDEGYNEDEVVEEPEEDSNNEEEYVENNEWNEEESTGEEDESNEDEVEDTEVVVEEPEEDSNNEEEYVENNEWNEEVVETEEESTGEEDEVEDTEVVVETEDEVETTDVEENESNEDETQEENDEW